jgi:hypothetical protein
LSATFLNLNNVLRWPFKLFRRIHKDVSKITKTPFLKCCLQSREQVKSAAASSGDMGDVPVLSHCSLPRNSSPKPTGVLEHCREGETSSWSSILQGVSI